MISPTWWLFLYKLSNNQLLLDRVYHYDQFFQHEVFSLSMQLPVSINDSIFWKNYTNKLTNHLLALVITQDLLRRNLRRVVIDHNILVIYCILGLAWIATNKIELNIQSLCQQDLNLLHRCHFRPTYRILANERYQIKGIIENGKMVQKNVNFRLISRICGQKF